MDTVSAAGTVAVLVGVAVLVSVGSAGVGVREGVAVGASSVGVADGPIAVGVRVRVGAVTCVITNERTVDHAPFLPLAVRPRTRHQNVRWLVNV